MLILHYNDLKFQVSEEWFCHQITLRPLVLKSPVTFHFSKCRAAWYATQQAFGCGKIHLHYYHNDVTSLWQQHASFSVQLSPWQQHPTVIQAPKWNGLRSHENKDGIIIIRHCDRLRGTVVNKIMSFFHGSTFKKIKSASRWGACVLYTKGKLHADSNYASFRSYLCSTKSEDQSGWRRGSRETMKRHTTTSDIWRVCVRHFPPSTCGSSDAERRNDTPSAFCFYLSSLGMWCLLFISSLRQQSVIWSRTFWGSDPGAISIFLPRNRWRLHRPVPADTPSL